MSRRTKGEGTIRKRSDGRWEGRYVNCIGETKSVYGQSKSDVKRRLQEITYNDSKIFRDVRGDIELDIWFEHYIKIKDSITNNPENKDPVGLLAKYCLPIYSTGARVMSSEAYMQVGMASDEQRDAAKQWNDCDTSLFLPTLPFTNDEQDIISDTMGDIQTYYKDMFVKFVMGVEPLSNFDSYTANLNKMGIDKVLKCYQDAYTRYEKE